MVNLLDVLIIRNVNTLKNSITKKGKDMFVQFIHALLIIMYINILIVHNILVVKKILLAMYNVVVVVIINKKNKGFSFIFCL